MSTHTLYARNPVGSQSSGQTQNLWAAGLSKQILIWIGLVSGLLIVSFLFLWRYNRVARRHRPTLRAVLLPVNLSIPALGIKPCPIRERPPPVDFTLRRNPRRSRRVSGAEIGTGGRRLGQRDMDDDLETGSVFSLPEYKANSGLPDYAEAWSGQDATSRDADQPANMMSVDEYERQTRATNAADGPVVREMGEVPGYMSRVASRTDGSQPTPAPAPALAIPPLPLRSNLTQHSSGQRLRELLRLPAPIHPRDSSRSPRMINPSSGRRASVTRIVPPTA